MGKQDQKILVVDDEVTARSALAALLKQEGYAVDTAGDGFKALASAESSRPSIVLADVNMPGMDGIELMRKLKERGSDAVVVLMTAFPSARTAVFAMHQGAADYLIKPIDTSELFATLERIARSRTYAESARAGLPGDATAQYPWLGGIVGRSPEARRLFKILVQVAPSNATVLLTGESGTGKELVADALHRGSPRAAAPLMRVNCAALAQSLIESELFGHERGAYTGADRRREGRFEAARGGTLFLDEIGELPPAVQVKLLRFLQEREFERVGGNETIHADVRVIAATNRNLPKLVAAGTFRADLFYRLNVITIQVPSLRERRSDIPALAAHFVRRHACLNHKPDCALSDATLAVLNDYDWPGNIRELENAIEHAVVMLEGRTIEPRHLPPGLAAVARQHSTPAVPGATLQEIERHAIVTTMESTGGSTHKAARILGVSVRMIQYRLQEYTAMPKSNVPAVLPRATETKQAR